MTKNFSTNTQTHYLIFLLILFKLAIMVLLPLHHPSEARYAAISMRMALTNNYLMPFFSPDTPFFGKPPLSFWASAIFFEMFGFSAFVGRLPHLLALLATTCFIYHCIKKIYDKETALNTAIILITSVLFFAAQSIMTEAFLLLGMTISTFSFFMQLISKNKNIYGYLFFIGCVISMLTKGPVGIIMPCFSIFIYLLISKRWSEVFKKFPLVSGSIIFLALTLPWFYLAEKNYPGFLEYFIVGENIGRFAKSGWEGDRYGHAHHVAFAMIWVFFIFSTIPANLIFLTQAKKIVKTAIDEIKKDKAKFLFFFLSFAAPLIVLTFMRNMIMTYAIYSLAAFAVILGIIVVKNKWHKFAYTISCISIGIHLILAIMLVIRPETILTRINYQDLLLRKIPSHDFKNNNFKLYYMGDPYGIYTLYWYSHDNLTILDRDNFLEKTQEPTDKKQYLLTDNTNFNSLSDEQRSLLKTISCSLDKHSSCLYELVKK